MRRGSRPASERPTCSLSAKAALSLCKQVAGSDDLPGLAWVTGRITGREQDLEGCSKDELQDGYGHGLKDPRMLSALAAELSSRPRDYSSSTRWSRK